MESNERDKMTEPDKGGKVLIAAIIILGGLVATGIVGHILAWVIFTIGQIFE